MLFQQNLFNEAFSRNHLNNILVMVLFLLELIVWIKCLMWNILLITPNTQRNRKIFDENYYSKTNYHYLKLSPTKWYITLMCEMRKKQGKTVNYNETNRINWFTLIQWWDEKEVERKIKGEYDKFCLWIDRPINNRLLINKSFAHKFLLKH